MAGLIVEGVQYQIQNAGQSYSLSPINGDSFRFEVRGGDYWSIDTSHLVNRSELSGSALYEQKKEIDVSYTMNIESGSPNTAKWVVLGQFHQSVEDGRSPPFSIGMEGEKMIVTVAHSSVDGKIVYGTIYKDTADIVRGHDYDFQIAATFNGDGIGRLTISRDGVTLVDYTGQLGWAGMGDLYWKEGVYRSLASETLAATFSNLDISVSNTGNAGNIDPATVQTPIVSFKQTLLYDTGASATDYVTSNGNYTLTGKATAGSMVVIQDGSAVLGTVTANGYGDWSFGGKLVEGAHNLKAFATLGGITHGSDAAPPILVDLTKPVAATVGGFSAGDGLLGELAVVNSGGLKISGTAEANNIVKVYIDGNQVGQVTADANGAWTYDNRGNTLANGMHWLQANASDQAGNSGGWSNVIQAVVASTAPTVKFTSTLHSDLGASATDNITSYGKVTLAGTATAGSTIKVVDGSTVLGTVTVGGSGSWAYTGTLGEGAHQLRAEATLNGLTSTATDTRNIIIDTTAPGQAQIGSLVPQVLASNGQVYSNTGKVTYSGTAEAGAKVTVQVDGKNVGDVLANSQGKWSYDASAVKLTDGAHWAIAVATDTAGNQGAWAKTFTFNVDTTAPTLSFSNAGQSSTAFSPYGKAEAGGQVIIQEHNQTLQTLVVSSGGWWSANLNTSQTVAHSYYVTAFDLAGNASSSYKLLAGTAAADVITATKAGDVIFTGYGKDIVVLDATTANTTAILDFQVGQDKIQFTGFGAGATVRQLDSTHWAVADATHSATFEMVNAVGLSSTDYAFV